ncbi:hypothetical protein [Chromobacterium subtsugae]|uniref:hypothetical protein n=1 Tax=Chromobacterium subtsugae TaxID=251747 RepID=UPI000A918AF5|nr:hypothetical protein [Chromobacterium subtsugae]
MNGIVRIFILLGFVVFLQGCGSDEKINFLSVKKIEGKTIINFTSSEKGLARGQNLISCQVSSGEREGFSLNSDGVKVRGRVFDDGGVAGEYKYKASLVVYSYKNGSIEDVSSDDVKAAFSKSKYLDCRVIERNYVAGPALSNSIKMPVKDFLNSYS